MDGETRKLKKVTVLMDSGAECSFIDTTLAEELHLTKIVNTTLRVLTVGSDEVIAIASRKVPSDIWDENVALRMELFTHDIVTRCDQIWQLIRQDQTHIRLPSGLHLLPTRIGHLLTGRLHNACQVTPLLKKDDGLPEWDKFWSLETKTLMMNNNSGISIGTMEKDGIEDFAGTVAIQ
ncbi:hypothetical protein COOONC_07456 [Cooperia oncophora]